MKRILALILFIVTASCAADQSIDATDKGIANYLDKISYWRENANKDPNNDSIGDANDRLEQFLIKTLKAPKTLTAKFEKAQQNGLTYASSDDGLLRFYDWDTYLGGTMHIFTDYAQYKTSKGIVVQKIVNTDSTVEGDPGCFYEDVYSVKTSRGNLLYLITYGQIGSNRDKGEGIIAYTITNDKLINEARFKTATKTLSQIDYGYDYFLSDEHRPQIHFSADDKKLFIPIVTKEGAFTNKFIVYVFDGDNFVFDKNAK